MALGRTVRFECYFVLLERHAALPILSIRHVPIELLSRVIQPTHSSHQWRYLNI